MIEKVGFRKIGSKMLVQGFDFTMNRSLVEQVPGSTSSGNIFPPEQLILKLVRPLVGTRLEHRLGTNCLVAATLDG